MSGWQTIRCATAGGLALLLVPWAAWAAEVLDDSQSPRQSYQVQLEWAYSGDAASTDRDTLQKMTAVVPDVEVRLNTSPYVGQSVRIYLALPIQIRGLSGSDGFALAWTTRGTLYSGSTTPGNRALIFEGNLDAPQLIDFFTFTIDADASRLNGELRYAPIFEIERF